ncbi:hypothetical protein DSY14_26735, partial [Nocardiopsis sp. MG754419]|nr:hypothetical protein [Nocardiopsis sp. MG754419]
MVPSAWALRTAGHEVRVASQPELGPDITAAGLTAVPVGRDHQLWRVLKAQGKEYRARLPPFDRPATPGAEVTWEYLRDGYADVVPWWLRLVNDPMVEDLTEFCRWWRPDLVVWEPTTYAGAIAA